MGRNILIVEGETEEKFFSDFKPNMKKIHRIIIYNLSQNDVEKNRKIVGQKYDLISVIFDADLDRDSNIECILKNLKTLKSCCDDINIYIQSKNFEDELEFAIDECNSFNDLCNVFNCKSTSKREFKRKFININDLKNKQIKINFHLLYTRDSKLKEILKERKFVSKIKEGKNLFSKKYLI